MDQDPRVMFNGVNYVNEELARTTRAKNTNFEKKHPRGRNGLFAKKAAPTPVRPENDLTPAGSNPYGGLIPSKEGLDALLAGPVNDPDRATSDKFMKLDIKDDPGFNKYVLGLATGALNEVLSYDKKMPKVAVKQEPFPDVQGQPNPSSANYDPDKRLIKINKLTDDKASSLIHEFSHHFDATGGGGGDKWLSDSFEFKQAYMQTAKCKDIYNRYQAAIRGEASPDEERKIGGYKYFLTPAEVFARGLTQYVAKRCSNKAIKAEVRRDKTSWPDNDFAPVEKYFDKLFKARRMRR